MANELLNGTLNIWFFMGLFMVLRLSYLGWQDIIRFCRARWSR